MPMIEMADGVQLFVQDWGQGTPTFFVNGWPFEHRMFENQMAALGYYHGTRVMGIDLRGFGQSDKPWEVTTTTPGWQISAWSSQNSTCAK